MDPKCEDFDATEYWRERHRRLSSLEATGTLGAPLAWQKWLYMGKLRAYIRALRAVAFDLRGASVLDFGCGSGYFEDAWESLGAVQTAGIDLVESIIDDLQGRHPQRQYLCANLGNDPRAAEGLGTFSLVTAIDVMYHIVDEAQIGSVMEALVRRIALGGVMLLTDSLVDRSPAPHVRFRSLQYWAAHAAAHGMSVVHVEPVFVLQNRPTVLSRMAPSLTGRLSYLADGLLLRRMQSRANNFAVLFKRK